MAEERISSTRPSVRVVEHLSHGAGSGIVVGSLVEINGLPRPDSSLLLLNLDDIPLSVRRT